MNHCPRPLVSQFLRCAQVKCANLKMGRATCRSVPYLPNIRPRR